MDDEGERDGVSRSAAKPSALTRLQTWAFTFEGGVTVVVLIALLLGAGRISIGVWNSEHDRSARYAQLFSLRDSLRAVSLDQQATGTPPHVSSAHSVAGVFSYGTQPPVVFTDRTVDVTVVFNAARDRMCGTASIASRPDMVYVADVGSFDYAEVLTGTCPDEFLP